MFIFYDLSNFCVHIVIFNCSMDKYALVLWILMFANFKVIRDRKSFLKLSFLLVFSPDVVCV